MFLLIDRINNNVLQQGFAKLGLLEIFTLKCLLAIGLIYDCIGICKITNFWNKNGILTVWEIFLHKWSEIYVLVSVSA